jgi:hypothetical protein
MTGKNPYKVNEKESSRKTSRIVETAPKLLGSGLDTLNVSFTSSEDEDLFDKEKASNFSSSTKYR